VVEDGLLRHRVMGIVTGKRCDIGSEFRVLFWQCSRHDFHDNTGFCIKIKISILFTKTDN